MSEKLHYEDFVPGAQYALGEYLVERDEVIDFARRFDPQPFHVDETAARASPLGRLCACGSHTFAICHRLAFDRVYGRAAAVAGAGVENIRFLTPLLPGDVLTGVATIGDCRASRSQGDRGIVAVGLAMRNQRGDKVATMETSLVVLRRQH
ncbi:MAG: MaoC/PaaZ C-terminal domain-containing protein [Rubrivivax sp.]